MSAQTRLKNRKTIESLYFRRDADRSNNSRNLVGQKKARLSNHEIMSLPDIPLPPVQYLDVSDTAKYGTFIPMVDYDPPI